MRPALAPLALVLPALLAACATTPEAQCRARIDREIREVDREMDTLSRTIARGYIGTGPNIEAQAQVCSGSGVVRVCFGGEDTRPLNRVPIDTSALAVQRDALSSRREALVLQRNACGAALPPA